MDLKNIYKKNDDRLQLDKKSHSLFITINNNFLSIIMNRLRFFHPTYYGI